MTRTVTVNIIGLVQKDYRMIRNIMSLASSKDHMYRLVTDSREQADIVIVNADDAAAMAFWNEYRHTVPNANAILASATPLFDSDSLFIKRPLIADQLHAVLTLDCAWAPSPDQQKHDVLKKSILFRYLSTTHLEKIMALSQTVLLPSQHVVFTQGGIGEEMWVILTGRLKISVTRQDGPEIVLGLLGPGEIFGEIAMLDGRARSASAITLTPCELLGIHRKDFMPFLEQNPKAAVDLITVLALRLRLNTEQLVELIAEHEAPR